MGVLCPTLGTPAIRHEVRSEHGESKGDNTTSELETISQLNYFVVTYPRRLIDRAQNEMSSVCCALLLVISQHQQRDVEHNYSSEHRDQPF